MDREQKEKMARRIQTSHIYDNEQIDRELLYGVGQSERAPMVLASDEKEAVIIKQDKQRTPRYGPTEVTHIAIVEGECQHCGSNRLESGHKEPGGIHYIACPVCNRDNMSAQYEFNYSLD